MHSERVVHSVCARGVAHNAPPHGAPRDAQCALGARGARVALRARGDAHGALGARLHMAHVTRVAHDALSTSYGALDGARGTLGARGALDAL